MSMQNLTTKATMPHPTSKQYPHPQHKSGATKSAPAPSNNGGRLPSK